MWNKVCASSWLNSEINVLRCTVRKRKKKELLLMWSKFGIFFKFSPLKYYCISWWNVWKIMNWECGWDVPKMLGFFAIHKTAPLTKSYGVTSTILVMKLNSLLLVFQVKLHPPFQSLVVTICTTRFKNKKFYFPPTKYFDIFCMDLRTNNDYFPIQH